jgi:hypothetical protein
VFIISITMKESRPDWLDIRTWRQVLRAAHKAMGDYWLHECLPQHFDQSKQCKYAYDARDAYYVRWKVAKAPAHSAADLIYSGQTQEAVLTSGYCRGYPTRATVIAVAPKYIGYRKNHDMVNEIERMTEEEKRACAEVLNSTFLRLMGFAEGTFQHQIESREIGAGRATKRFKGAFDWSTIGQF